MLNYLCDPLDKSNLTLKGEKLNEDGSIESGLLVSTSGREYPIINGVPRFIEQQKEKQKSVKGFGDQWNNLNFNDFKWAWLAHTVGHTFGTPKHFEGKTIVDCGAGHGMQSRWMAESGAKHVIALELSHAVDHIFNKNLKGIKNVDVIQCSIDMPPLKDQIIKDGIVICHNVIQHTPSVQNTARALWRIAGENSEFVFNCYQKYNPGLLRKIRWALYKTQRFFISKLPHSLRYRWCQFVCAFRMLPGLGEVMEKLMIATQGDMQGHKTLKKRFRSCVVNTFDGYGAHKYQHHLTDEELEEIIQELQPEKSKVKNRDTFFAKPPPIGVAIRLFK